MDYHIPFMGSLGLVSQAAHYCCLPLVIRLLYAARNSKSITKDFILDTHFIQSRVYISEIPERRLGWGIAVDPFLAVILTCGRKEIVAEDCVFRPVTLDLSARREGSSALPLMVTHESRLSHPFRVRPFSRLR